VAKLDNLKTLFIRATIIVKPILLRDIGFTKVLSKLKIILENGLWDKLISFPFIRDFEFFIYIYTL
jgi:hypothetical protein